MPMRPSKRAPKFTSKPRTKLNHKWLDKALRSVGAASSDAFKSMAPNVTNAAQTAKESVSETVNTLKSSNAGIKQIGKRIQNNSYVKMAKDAIDQSIDDVKKGSLYNPSRSSGAGEEIDDILAGLEEFADEDDSVIFNYMGDENDDEEYVDFADTVGQYTTSTLQASKAIADTMVATTTINATLIEDGFTRVTDSLGDINNNVAAMLQFQQENTLQFYENMQAAIEKIGTATTQEEDDIGADKDTAADLFSSDGKFNFQGYKKFIKDQLKSAAEGSPVGALLPYLTDEEMVKMLLQDPVGGLTKAVVGGMIPGIVQKGIKEVDKTLGELIPSIGMKFAKMAEDENSTIFQKYIGKIFGLKVDKKDNIALNELNGAQVAFDDITRNAIVEVLPHYARESTAYLKAIAEKVTDQKSQDMIDSSQIFNTTKMKYESIKDIKRTIAEELRDAAIDPYKSSEFGSAMQSVTNDMSKKQREKYERALEQFYAQLNNQKTLDVSDFDPDGGFVKSLLNKVDADNKTKNIIKATITELYNNNEALGSLSIANLQGRNAWNQKTKDIEKQYAAYNTIDAGINDKTSLTQFMEEQLEWEAAQKYRLDREKEEEKRERKQELQEERDRRKEQGIIPKTAKQIAQSGIKDWREDQEATREREQKGGGIARSFLGEDFGQGFAKAAGHAKNSMWAIMKGDSKGAVSEFASIFTDQMKTMWNGVKSNFFEPLGKQLFGEKDESGYKKNGLFKNVHNKTKDTWNEFVFKINGRSYTDSEGVEHTLEDEDETLVDKVTGIFKGTKDSMKKYLFGDKDADDNGEEEKGIVGSAMESLKRGVKGWKDALFGETSDDETDEEPKIDKEGIKKKIMDALPSTLTGGIAGTIFGAMSGGSLLGAMVGGPVGGAVVGLAGGLLSRSEKFKNWLFGPEDDDGGRIGGFISKKTQDFFKNNKSTIIGGAALGAIKSMIFPSSAGLLTSVFGGPIAGAAMGAGFGLLKKSEMFQEFLYGNEEKGKRGVINALKGIFKGKNDKESDDEKKVGGRKRLLKGLGMGAIGAAGGALTSGLVGQVGIMGAMLTPGGPLMGAVLGGAIGISAAGAKFSKWLFGEKDPDTGEKKGGMIHKVGNWMEVEVLDPLKSKALNIADDIKSTIKYDILDNIRLPFVAVADTVRDHLGNAKEMVGDFIGRIGDKVSDKVIKPVGKTVAKMFKPMRDVMSKATDFIYGATKAVVTAPFKIMGGIAKSLKSPVMKVVRGANRLIWKGVKTVAKPFLAVPKIMIGMTKFVGKRFLDVIGFGRGLFTGIGKAIDNVTNLIPGMKGLKQGIKEKHEENLAEGKDIRSRVGRFMGKITNDPWMRDYRNSKAERREELNRNKQARKQRSNMDYNRSQIAKILGYDVKYFTEENYERAKEEAKRQKVRLNIRGDLSKDGAFETDKDAERKKLLSRSTAELAAEASQSEDVDLRQLSEQHQTNEYLKTIAEKFDITIDEARAMYDELAESREDDRARAGLDEDGNYIGGRAVRQRNREKRKEEKRRAREDRNNEENPEEITEETPVAEIRNNTSQSEEDNSDELSRVHDTEGALNELREYWRQKEERRLNDTRSASQKFKDYFSIRKGWKNSELHDSLQEGKEKVKNFFRRNDHARAEGGETKENEPYLVGDADHTLDSAEIFVPKTRGTIIPNGENGINVNINSIDPVVVNTLGEMNAETTPTPDISDMLPSTEDDVAIQKSIARHNRKMVRRGVTAEIKLSTDTESTATLDNLISDQTNEYDSTNAILRDALNADDPNDVTDDGQYERLRSIRDEEKERQKDNERADRMLGALENIHGEQKEHDNIWSKIFSKKGLLTAGLLMMLPTIMDNLPKILDFVGGIKDKIRSIFDKMEWTEEKDARTNGESSGERLQDNVEDFGTVVKDLLTGHPIEALKDFILDEGQYDSGSGSRVSFLVNTARNSKVLKGAAKLGKKAAKGAKKIGEKALKGGRFVKDLITKRGASELTEDSLELLSREMTENAAAKEPGVLKKGINKIKGAARNIKGMFKQSAMAGADDSIDIWQQALRDNDTSSAIGRGMNKVKDKASRVARSTKSFTNNVGGKISNTKVGKAVSKATDFVDDVAKKVGGTKIGGVVSKVANAPAGVMKAAKEGAKTGASKVMTLVQKALTSILEKAKSKFPKVAEKLSGGLFNKLIAKVGKVVTTRFPQILEKISLAVSKTASGVATLGLSTATFATIGAINGASGAERLFHVDKADFTMRLISAVIGALDGATIMGSVISIVSELVFDVTGVDFLSEVAGTIYQAVMGAEKYDELENAQAEFQDKYLEYQTEELEKQFKTKREAGLIDEDTTLEQFAEQVESGEEKISYKSFQDYNADEHQTFGYKIGKNVTEKYKQAKSFLFGGENMYTAMDGKQYKDNGDGTYQVFDPDGNDIGYVSQDAVNVDYMEKSSKDGLFTPAINGVKEFGSNVIGGVKAGASAVWNGLKETGNALLHPVETGKKALKFASWLLTDTREQVYVNKEDGSYYNGKGEHFNADGEPLGDSIDLVTMSSWTAQGILSPQNRVIEKSGFNQAWDTLRGGIKHLGEKAVDKFNSVKELAGEKVENVKGAFQNFFIGSEQEAFYKKDGSGYYVKNGDMYDFYNMTGELIKEKAIGNTEITASLSMGILEKGDPIKIPSTLTQFKDKVKNVVGGKLTALKESAIDAFKSSAEKAGQMATNAIEKIRDWVPHKEKVYFSADGSGYYRASGKGYTKYDMHDDVVQDDISEEDMKAIIEAGLVQEGEKDFKSTLADDAIELGKSFLGKAKDMGAKVLKIWDKVTEVHDKWAQRVEENGGLIGAVTSFFSKRKSIVFYTADMKGYYKANGDKFDFYNMNGDKVDSKSGISSEKLQDMIDANLVKEGEEMTQDSEAKEAINKVKNAVSGAWTKAKDTVVNAWDKFKNFLGGGSGSGPEDLMGGSGTGIGGSGNGKIINFNEEKNKIQEKRKSMLGGRGPEQVDKIDNKEIKASSESEKSGQPDDIKNNFAYYSQEDPKWKNKEYISGVANDGATMGDTGCGPTAMAMIAQQATKGKVTPVDMAQLASVSGYRDETGTNAEFISYAGDQMGIPHQDIDNPSGTYIQQQVQNGNPVVLNGVGGNGSAFTKAGHYVVATGTDDRGNILVNDPRGKQYSKAYAPDQLASETRRSWAFGGKGKGRKSLKTILGGFGGESNGTGVTSGDVIAVAKSELGYLEKASNSNLEDKSGNAGSANFTKFAPYVGHANGLAWCATFVTYCFVRAANGNKETASKVLCGANTAGCAANETAFRRANRWRSGSQAPQPGDVIFYTHSHTGLVTEVNGSTFKTIEGNTSGGQNYERNGGCVAEKVRNVGDSKIKGFGVPAFDGTSAFNGDLSSSAVSVDSSSSGSSSSSSSTGGFTGTLAKIGNVFTSFASKAMEGILTGNWNYDFSDAINGGNSSSSDSGSSSGGSISSVQLSGSENKEKIWNFLTNDAGLSKEGASGVMGCWESESKNTPNRLEGDYLKSVGTDKVPSIIASNESLDNFTTGTLFPAYARSGMSINQGAYKGDDGHYYPGLGLAQWTGQRAANLKNFASRSNGDWGALDTQLNFFLNGEGEFGGRSALKQQLNSAQSPEDAATYFLDGFEMNRSGWHTTGTGSKQNTERRGNARAIYDMYKDTTVSTLDSSGDTSGDKTKDKKKKSKKGGNGFKLGGFGKATTSTTDDSSYKKLLKTSNPDMYKQLYGNDTEAEKLDDSGYKEVLKEVNPDLYDTTYGNKTKANKLDDSSYKKLLKEENPDMYEVEYGNKTEADELDDSGYADLLALINPDLYEQIYAEEEKKKKDAKKKSASKKKASTLTKLKGKKASKVTKKPKSSKMSAAEKKAYQKKQKAKKRKENLAKRNKLIKENIKLLKKHGLGPKDPPKKLKTQEEKDKWLDNRWKKQREVIKNEKQKQKLINIEKKRQNAIDKQKSKEDKKETKRIAKEQKLGKKLDKAQSADVELDFDQQAIYDEESTNRTYDDILKEINPDLYYETRTDATPVTDDDASVALNMGIADSGGEEGKSYSDLLAKVNPELYSSGSISPESFASDPGADLTNNKTQAVQFASMDTIEQMQTEEQKKNQQSNLTQIGGQVISTQTLEKLLESAVNILGTIATNTSGISELKTSQVTNNTSGGNVVVNQTDNSTNVTNSKIGETTKQEADRNAQIAARIAKGLAG